MIKIFGSAALGLIALYAAFESAGDDLLRYIAAGDITFTPFLSPWHGQPYDPSRLTMGVVLFIVAVLSLAFCVLAVKIRAKRLSDRIREFAS